MALINCPECGATVSDRAAACPRCGCPVDGPAPAPEKPGKTRRFFASRKGERTLGVSERLGCLGVLLAVAALLLLGNYLVNRDRVDYVPKAADAYEMVKIEVKKNLKARSPVRFPSVDQAEVSQLDRNTFRIGSSYYVKDQGGDRSSTRFTAVIRYTGDGEYNIYDWELVSLNYY